MPESIFIFANCLIVSAFMLAAETQMLAVVKMTADIQVSDVNTPNLNRLGADSMNACSAAPALPCCVTHGRRFVALSMAGLEPIL